MAIYISLTSKLTDLSFSRQLILEIELSNFRPKDFKKFHNSLGFPMFSVSLLSKYAFFFVRISFCTSFLASLWLYLSTCKREFSIFLKSLSLSLIFSMISASNQFCDVPVMRLFLLGARLSITAMTFWMNFSQAASIWSNNS